MFVRGVVLALACVWTSNVASAGPARRFAATSSAVVTIKKDDTSFFGASASDQDWGAPLPPQKVAHGDRAFYPLFYTTPSLTDPFGCTSPEELQNASTSFALPAENGSFVLLVDRGRCSYSLKALFAKRLGAVALIVTDTQQQAYNRTLAADATDITRALEYSCTNGRADVEAREAKTIKDFTSPKWANAVNALRCASSSSCDSSLCIPSGKSDRQVCCLWDVADQIAFANSSNDVGVNRTDVADLSVVRLRIADGETLKALIANTSAAADDQVLVTLYERGAPLADPSQFIVWLLAIVTVMCGGYKGATLERERAQRKQSALLLAEGVGVGVHTADTPSLADGSVATGTTAPVSSHSTSVDGGHEDDETLDLTMYHALGFVVFATAFLLVLFYWNVVLVVVIFFAVGAVSCSFVILWQPLFSKISFLRRRPLEKNPPSAAWLAALEPETWSLADGVALLWSVAISILWFIYRNRQYAWLLQDVFGICLCILFLRTIRLPNLKVATFMLVLVFLYDIFMVFISALIFSESLMISAATGGSQGSSTAGSDFCLRYPTNTEYKCMKEALPILLRFPKVIDWRAGQSMLGLGDIVLPGLLIVFCARFDYATRGQLLGRVKAPHLARLKSSHQLNALETDAELHDFQQQQPQQQQPAMAELSTQGAPMASRRGLFGIMMWGYAIGLLLANIGVMVTKQGQPALMYLVPTTLGLLYVIAWRRGILKKLWDGPEEFRPCSAESAAAAAAQSNSMSMRDRGHEADDQEDMVVISSETTPVSTYSRPEDTPKYAGTSDLH